MNFQIKGWLVMDTSVLPPPVSEMGFAPRGVRRHRVQPLSVLLIDGRDGARKALRNYLLDQDFAVFEAVHPDEAEERVNVEAFDVVVLAIRRSVMTVSNFLQRVSARSAPAIIMISENSDSTERILALQLGADDLVTRDCNHPEVVARIQSVLRRVVRKEPEGGIRPTETDSKWVLNEITRTLTSPSGVRTDLSPRDFEILNLFLDQDQGMVTDEVIARIYGDANGNAGNNMRVMVSRLRRRIGGSEDPFPIVCVRGAGYRLDTSIRRVSDRGLNGRA